MKKVFFFDIDGTLAIRHDVPENNKKALQLLKDKGYLTFICTGRAPFYAKKLFGDLVSGYICCNGRYILYNNEKLHGEAFTEDELSWYLKKFKEENFGALLVSDDVSMCFNLDEHEIEDAMEDYGKEHIAKYDANLPVYTFDIFYHHINNREYMIDIFKDKLLINDHNGCGNCDCSTIDYDKGNAIAYILNHFQISKDNAYAFGDGYNDQAMFREVNNCIAMGNAVDKLKEKATFITDDVDKDGITKALVHEGIFDNIK